MIVHSRFSQERLESACAKGRLSRRSEPVRSPREDRRPHEDACLFRTGTSSAHESSEEIPAAIKVENRRGLRGHGVVTDFLAPRPGPPNISDDFLPDPDEIRRMGRERVREITGTGRK